MNFELTVFYHTFVFSRSRLNAQHVTSSNSSMILRETVFRDWPCCSYHGQILKKVAILKTLSLNEIVKYWPSCLHISLNKHGRIDISQSESYFYFWNTLSMWMDSREGDYSFYRFFFFHCVMNWQTSYSCISSLRVVSVWYANSFLM